MAREGLNDAQTATFRVGLDVTQAVKTRGRGIARYIHQVLEAMPPDSVSAELYIRGHRWFRRTLIQDLAPHVSRRWLINPGRLSANNLELFHSFGNHLPRRSNVPLSFTVHDVRALDEPAGYEGKERLQRNIRLADGIICLTEYGRGRLLHHYPELASGHVAVIPHGVDQKRFCPNAISHSGTVAERYGLHQPYLLQLGSWFPHKNLELSIEAFSRSRVRSQGAQLVFVGGGAPDSYRQRLDALAERTAVGGQLRWIEHVPAEDLPALLAGAQCLLQPSRYEGFALPLLEAMAVGLPGVVSDASCLPEVSAGIWPVAGADEPEDFAAGMDRMATPGQQREAAVTAGLAHAKQFTWERTARAHDRFYRDIIQATRR